MTEIAHSTDPKVIFDYLRKIHSDGTLRRLTDNTAPEIDGFIIVNLTGPCDMSIVQDPEDSHFGLIIRFSPNDYRILYGDEEYGEKFETFREAYIQFRTELAEVVG